jgi:hypothetical protein
MGKTLDNDSISIITVKEEDMVYLKFIGVFVQVYLKFDTHWSNRQYY